MVQVNTEIIEPYPTNASVSIFSNLAFDDHNAPVQYPLPDQHQQGYNGPFFYNAGNWNGAGEVTAATAMAVEIILTLQIITIITPETLLVFHTTTIIIH
ncbi:uncharacterized protein DS421_13g435880 [Arachis hypogaea]|nr:uncharacterized protein DS421_13g435880 [Arachis hypogaea]